MSHCVSQKVSWAQLTGMWQTPTTGGYQPRHAGKEDRNSVVDSSYRSGLSVISSDKRCDTRALVTTFTSHFLQITFNVTHRPPCNTLSKTCTIVNQDAYSANQIPSNEQPVQR